MPRELRAVGGGAALRAAPVGDTEEPARRVLRWLREQPQEMPIVARIHRDIEAFSAAWCFFSTSWSFSRCILFMRLQTSWWNASLLRSGWLEAVLVDATRSSPMLLGGRCPVETEGPPLIERDEWVLGHDARRRVGEAQSAARDLRPDARSDGARSALPARAASLASSGCASGRRDRSRWSLRAPPEATASMARRIEAARPG